MPIGTHFSIYIKIVQQHKVFDNFVLVGCNMLSKKQEGCIPVATLYITQDLIIGPVFFDDVKNMFDGRR